MLSRRGSSPNSRRTGAPQRCCLSKPALRDAAPGDARRRLRGSRPDHRNHRRRDDSGTRGGGSRHCRRRSSVGGFVGYADGAYRRVRHDLDGDGSTVGDTRLALPRLARLTYGLDARYTRELARGGRLSTRVSIAASGCERSLGGQPGSSRCRRSPRRQRRILAVGCAHPRPVRTESAERGLAAKHFRLTGLVESTYSPLKEGRGSRRRGTREAAVSGAGFRQRNRIEATLSRG